MMNNYGYNPNNWGNQYPHMQMKNQNNQNKAYMNNWGSNNYNQYTPQMQNEDYQQNGDQWEYNQKQNFAMLMRSANRGIFPAVEY